MSANTVTTTVCFQGVPVREGGPLGLDGFVTYCRFYTRENLLNGIMVETYHCPPSEPIPFEMKGVTINEALGALHDACRNRTMALGMNR